MDCCETYPAGAAMNTILTLLSPELMRRYYAAGFWREDTIYSLVRVHAQRAPDKCAVREQLRRITYRELVAAADRVAADLANHGIRPGQRICIWLPSRIECAVALLACSRNGYACCPSLHRDHTVAEIIELLKRTRSAALVAQSGYGADAERRDVFAELGVVESLRRVYRLESVADDPTVFAGTQAAGAIEPVKRDPNRIVYLAFTSGTMGQPKGVMHSDNTLLANARAMASDWNIGGASVVYPLGPLSHNLGFGAMVMALSVGAELVVHDLAKGSSLVDRVLETGASFMVGVPAHASDLLQEMRDRDLTSLGRMQGFRISGASVSSEIVAGLIERGVVPQSGYGMTESCSHQYTLPSDDPKLIVETSGRPCSGYEIRIWRTDNRDIEAAVGEIGEIGGRGASLMLGYFDDQQATEDAFNAHGWFMTGDLGWIDANGYLRITGRKKDVIIRGGHNIHPARIETLVMRHDAVERAAAIPVRDRRLGERVCLAVVFRAGQRVEPRELLAHLDAIGLSKYDMPEYFLDLEHIPLTPSGKMRKRDLLEWIEQGRLSPMPIRWQSKRQASR
jgi:acyl-CoA synthetase (AMP-forming)/AMP-acid ligase II